MCFKNYKDNLLTEVSNTVAKECINDDITFLTRTYVFEGKPVTLRYYIESLVSLVYESKYESVALDAATPDRLKKDVSELFYLSLSDCFMTNEAW